MEKNSKKTYKGIDYYFDIFGTGEYSVNIGGKDYLFDTEEETKKAIDNKTALMLEAVKDRLKIDFYYHNKNLTKKQYSAIDECINTLETVKRELGLTSLIFRR